MTTTPAAAVVELGRLALQFGRVNRITYHPDGHRPETDTDHTVMLGLIACAFAASHMPDLDRGVIAAYALVPRPRRGIRRGHPNFAGWGYGGIWGYE